MDLIRYPDIPNYADHEEDHHRRLATRQHQDRTTRRLDTHDARISRLHQSSNERTAALAAQVRALQSELDAYANLTALLVADLLAASLPHPQGDA